MKRKNKSIQQLKKIADKWCSEWIRRKYANWKGETACYTCGATKPWKEIQCGHFVSRVYGNLRYYEPNLRPQCYSCNVMRHGNMDEYSLRLERETPGILEELNRWKRMPSTPFTWTGLNETIEDFKMKIKSLST